MPSKDVTSQVYIAGYDEEMVTITRCVCGHKFEPWEFVIDIYPENDQPCPNCGRNFYCSFEIRVWEVVEGDKDESVGNGS